MKIKEFLDQAGITQAVLAKELGYTRGYIHNIINGLHNPSTRLAHQLEIYSKGKIKVHEIRKCTHTCEPGCACSKWE